MAMLARLGARRISLNVAMCAARHFAAPIQCAVPLVRFASTSSASKKNSPESALLNSLRTEIEHEKGEMAQEPKPPKPPAPFALEDHPGSEEIILRRAYGTQNIDITCVFRLTPYDEPMEEEEDDEEADQPVSQEEVQMNVTISNSKEEGGPVLEVSCTCKQGEVDINHVSYHPSLESKKNKDNDMAYTGPDFDELEEELQEQFKKYLEVRGVNEQLCEFLVNYMSGKDHREYLGWLEKVERFVRS